MFPKIYTKLLICLIITTCFSYSQSFKVKGKIVASETRKPLPYASVRISGTTSGTSANHDGNFELKLKQGNHKLIFSYIGYKTDSLELRVPFTKTIEIDLEVQSVKLPEVVVKADEDPAYSIIREAIKRKKENRKGVVNFKYNAYSKRIVKSAGEVAVIEEVFLKGYNKVNEWEKEFVKSTFRTENIKKSSELFDFRVSDSYYIDFWGDTLSLALSKIYLPIAQNAFDHYDYKLLKIIEAETHLIYLIKVIPKSKIQPLLQGEITIESENYAMTSINLKSNQGVRFPYLNNLSMEFVQQLGKYKNYWLPNYIESKVRFEASFQGLLTIEPLQFHQLSNITEYKINEAIPDSIENAVSSKHGYFTTDTSKVDSVLPEISRNEIEEIRPIPLTVDEVEAYAKLDSTMKLEKMIKFGGPLSELIPDTDQEDDTTQGFLLSGLEVLSNYGLFRNNRATGILIGANYDNNYFDKTISLNPQIGYSLDRKKIEAKLNMSYSSKEFFINNIETEIYNYTKRWQTFTPYPDVANSISFSLGFEDQFNYYFSKGFSIGIGKNIGGYVSTSLKFTTEKQGSLVDLHSHSIINSSQKVRSNPEITEGQDSRTSLKLLFGNDPFELQIIPENGIIAQFDYSNNLLSGDFDYRYLRLAGILKTKTFYDELFVAPYLLLAFDGGFINGEYGLQHLLTPNSKLGVYSHIGSLKGIKPYEFVGTKMISLQLEHNWRTIIFQALGVDLLTDLHIDLVTGGSFLGITNDSEHKLMNSMKSTYWETYASISRILALFRIDFTYNSNKEFSVSTGVGVMF